MAETSIATLWPWKGFSWLRLRGYLNENIWTDKISTSSLNSKPHYLFQHKRCYLKHHMVWELAEKEPDNGVFKMLGSDVTRFLTTILIGTMQQQPLFGEAGVLAVTGVMTVAILLLTEITPKSIAVHSVIEVARFVLYLTLQFLFLGQASGMAFLGTLPCGKNCYISINGNAKSSWFERKKTTHLNEPNGFQLYSRKYFLASKRTGHKRRKLGLEWGSRLQAAKQSEPYDTEDELKLMLHGAELSGAIEEEEQLMILMNYNFLLFSCYDVKYK
ncbi:hypothetical protein Patl1_26615 [Pistacia atlantica]|uniref:Uncharacterized protein n=1 Tax=Pistacia atlantica TaxID=434234 RepID=A0ACC1AZI1_9ROSI|nr:hypothetical protein Patl1_26615 [Pistacia atlantica]